jgi:hypothetical protein
MKTVQKLKDDGTLAIKRVSDTKAEELVKNENWNYVAKAVWKEAINKK